jgi:hypothetical protein
MNFAAQSTTDEAQYCSLDSLWHSTLTLEFRNIVYNLAEPAVANLDLVLHTAKIADNFKASATAC